MFGRVPSLKREGAGFSLQSFPMKKSEKDFRCNPSRILRSLKALLLQININPFCHPEPFARDLVYRKEQKNLIKKKLPIINPTYSFH